MPAGDHGRTGGVVVTVQQIYEQLVRLTEEVCKMTAPIQQTARMVEDHEQRIRGLERWRYALPVTLVVGALSAMASAVAILWGH